MTRFFKLSLSLSLVMILVGCASSGAPTGSYSANNTGYNGGVAPTTTKSIPKSTEKLLAEAEAAGDRQQILATLKNIHAANPNDAVVASRYGRALREDDQINASVRILEPFTKGTNANDAALTEMAMAQLALGKFSSAEKYAKAATDINAKNGRAYLALGTALDAQKNTNPQKLRFVMD